MVAQVKLIDLAHYPVSGDLFLENEKCSVGFTPYPLRNHPLLRAVLCRDLNGSPDGLINRPRLMNGLCVARGGKVYK